MDLRQWGGKFAADEWKLVISASWQIDFSKGVFSGIDMLRLQCSAWILKTEGSVSAAEH